MLKLKKYPELLGVEYAPEIMSFDEELFKFIDELKEFAVENSLDGLSAPQVGSYYNVVLVKKDGEFLELINPKVIKTSGSIKTTEKTTYFGDITADITRPREITVVYEDRSGEQHFLNAKDEFAVLVQRKIDYVFGGTFLLTLVGKEKSDFEAKLTTKAEIIEESKEYPTKISNVVLVFMLFMILYSFSIEDTTKLKELWDYQLYLAFGLFLLNTINVTYLHFKNVKATECINCFDLNLIGRTSVTMLRVVLLVGISYFVF